MGSGKVVFVEFNSRRGRPKASPGGPGLVLGVFVVISLVEIVLAAALFPASIGTPLFGPTVVMVAVAGALGVNRIARRSLILGGHRRTASRGGGSDGPGVDGRTLH